METRVPTTAPACPLSPAKLLASLKGHASAATALAFTPDRCTLASGDRDGNGRIWSVASSKPGERATFRAPEAVKSLSFSPNGRLLAAGAAGAEPSDRLSAGIDNDELGRRQGL